MDETPDEDEFDDMRYLSEQCARGFHERCQEPLCPCDCHMGGNG